MFGYVTFYRDELKIKDFDKFKGYYCGLCKELGKRFNQLVRLGLSYDFTFLALILDSVDKSDTRFVRSGCFKHLGKKKNVVWDNPYVRYAADMSVALMYYKLIDDLKDSFSTASALAVLPYWFCVRKVKKLYPQKISVIKKELAALSALERAKCPSVDETADCFAKIMGTVFSDGEDALRELGYNIGRFIYIADATDDYEKDIRKNNYNPYRYMYPDADVREIKKTAGQSMAFTLSMAAQNYEKLEVVKNKDLLDNIIYLGLRQRMDMVISCDDCRKKGNKNGESI